MSVNVVLNGQTYTIPEPGDTAWGQNLTNYFVAQSTGLLQKAGGTFTLTAEVDFGATYGLKSAYFKSRSSNVSTTGIVRLASTDAIAWRNNANSANLSLAKDTSDNLTYAGVAFVNSSGVITGNNPVFTGTLTAANITASGAVSFTANGAASTPAVKLSGTPFSAGSATTNKALLLLEDSATSTGWNTAGTWFGINSAAFSGRFADFQVDGSSKFSVSSAGNTSVGGTLTVTGTSALSGATSLTASGAASTPALKLSGTPFSAGSATTNKALLLLEDSATSTGWSTAGTWLGINSAAFSGNFADFQVEAVSKFSVSSAGNTAIAGTLNVTGASTFAAVSGTTGAFSGDFAIATNKFTVASASGNTVVAGTLNVTGNATLSGTGNSVGTITSGAWNGTAISATYGGTGINTAASTGVAQVSAGTWSVSTTLQNAVQDNITRLGTVTSGTWNATAIGAIYGGTGQSSWATGDLLYASGTNTLAKLSGNTSTTLAVLTQTGNGSASAAPVWTSTTGTGNIVRATSPTLSGTLAAAAGTFSSTLSVTGTLTPTGGIKGISTNTDAATGNVGEYVQSVQSTFISTNTPTSTQFSDLTSISLGAGDWDVTAIVTVSLNGATVTILKTGISTTSGNSSSGLAEGSNLVNGPIPTSSNNSTAIVANYRMSLSGATTVYLKQYMSYSVATPQYTYRLSARRVQPGA